MKMPPREKIHEALSAIADDRVKLGDDTATVRSSGGGKEYTVQWADSTFSSNDSATYWQLYPGYPIIAVLLLQQRLPLRQDIAMLFSGINWTELNRKHKCKYDRAVEEVMQGLRESGRDIPTIEHYVAEVYRALGNLDLTVKRGSLRPPKEKTQ